MKRWKLLAAIAAVAPMIGALCAQDEPRTQDQPKADGGKTTQQRMPTFEPGKEHQALKQFDGEWEFKAKCNAPGMEPMEGTGTETARLTLGGFWLSVEDKGMMQNKDFNGQGFMGWDPQKKQYVGVWVDNHTPFMAKYMGEADSSGKVFTFHFKVSDEQKYGKSAKEAESDTGKAAESKGKDLGRDARKDYGKDQGKDLGKEPGKAMDKEAGMKCPERMVHEIKDQDHRTLRFYGKDDSGKEALWTEITYTRKPAMVK